MCKIIVLIPLEFTCIGVEVIIVSLQIKKSDKKEVLTGSCYWLGGIPSPGKTTRA